MKLVVISVIAVALFGLIGGAGAQTPSQHIFLSCDHVRTNLLREYPDGRIEKTSDTGPSTMPLDIDVDNKKIGHEYSIIHITPVEIAGEVSKWLNDNKDNPFISSNINIDRLSGQLKLSTTIQSAPTCTERFGKSRCYTSESISTYQCRPAAPKF